ncbi:MAG: SDR family oxidoreductase [Caldilineaceae bacterium]|nr:SDR family oxidoreductase [Caldilineaceae bacterium]
MKPILITGATGTVGGEVVRLLAQAGHPVRAAARRLPAASGQTSVDFVPFDFADPATYGAALAGVGRLLLVRPPAIGDAKGVINPFVSAAQAAGVEQVVFLSLIGVERNRFVPHHAIEAHIRAIGLPYTFLRAGFFMQNLSTTHRAEIADENRIVIPAGQSRTAFLDGRDIAAVAVRALTEDGHANRAYPLTGGAALSYAEVAAIFSEVLGRRIDYANPPVLGFVRHSLRLGRGLGMTLVMAALYTLGRGNAATITPDLSQLLSRPPGTLRQFVIDHRESWEGG